MQMVETPAREGERNYKCDFIIPKPKAMVPAPTGSWGKEVCFCRIL